jgi:hypothetical protein
MLDKIFRKLPKPGNESIPEKSITEDPSDKVHAKTSNSEPNPENLAQAIRHILEESSQPMNIDEITTNTLNVFPALAPEPIYNPRAAYRIGQRIFHGSPKYESWFTVKDRDNTSITCLFDDGLEIRLAHANPTLSWEPTFPTHTHTYLYSKIAIELKRIQGLYQRGDLWHNWPIPDAPEFSLDSEKNPDEAVQAQSPQKKDAEPLNVLCSSYHIEYFYHITRIENLTEILNKGLRCHKNVQDYEDISNSEIQQARSIKHLPQNPSLTLHDCVPLFIAPKPPMLSALREQQPNIIYLHLDPAVLLLSGAIFTDGNARSNATCFYQDLNDLAKLDWSLLRANYWNDPDPVINQENKRKRSAEVLVPWKIPACYIRAITTYNREMCRRVNGIVEQSGFNIIVVENRDFFFYVYKQPYSSAEMNNRFSPNYRSVSEVPEPPPNFPEDESWYL